nr:putative GED domain-containing protein DNM1P46 [Pongo abelii]
MGLPGQGERQQGRGEWLRQLHELHGPTAGAANGNHPEPGGLLHGHCQQDHVGPHDQGVHVIRVAVQPVPAWEPEHADGGVGRAGTVA